MGLFGKSTDGLELEKLGMEMKGVRATLHSLQDAFGQQKDELSKLKAVVAEQQECMQGIQSKAAESIELIAKVRSENAALARKKSGPASPDSGKLESRLKALEAAYESLRGEMESRRVPRAATITKISNSEELNMVLSDNARKIDEALGAIERMAKIIAK